MIRQESKGAMNSVVRRTGKTEVAFFSVGQIFPDVVEFFDDVDNSDFAVFTVKLEGDDERQKLGRRKATQTVDVPPGGKVIKLYLVVFNPKLSGYSNICVKLGANDIKLYGRKLRLFKIS